ncbi:P-loop containing nucleoside triphosphate hydrolase protein [Thamnidium elegans]|nr:P-loop containing nucleoside triphosphate hydrolase protein [Thamnidium elegans]
MAPLKVIGGGYGRTGTDSLRVALDTLGYQTFHMKRFWEDPTINPDDFYQAHINPKDADWDTLYKDYDAAIDWPTVNFYQELLERYPTAKVILTVRSADSWYESVKNTIHKNALLRGDSWRDPAHEKHLYYRMVYYTCMDGFICDAEKFKDEKLVKEMYLDHIQQVKLQVPKDQLLVMELGEGWENLCKFLNKDVPSIPYPRTNSTSDFQRYFKSKNEQYLKE